MRRSTRKTAGNKLESIISSLKGTEGTSQQEMATGGDDRSEGMPDHDPRPPSGLSRATSISREIRDLQAKNAALEYELERLHLDRAIGMNRGDPTSLYDDHIQHNQPGPVPQRPGKTLKSRKIVDFVWPNPMDYLDSKHYIDIGNGNQIYTSDPSKKLSLGKVTVEQYGYASIEILHDMQRTGEITQAEVPKYLSYVQSIFRLAANNLWVSVLLYDMEYRDRQAKENFEWGSFIPNLREFHLVQRPDSSTARAISEIQSSVGSVNSPKDHSQFSRRGKGPFLPNGKTICRRFNSGECYGSNCRLAHHCAICYSKNHNASQHSSSFHRNVQAQGTSSAPNQSGEMHSGKKEITMGR